MQNSTLSGKFSANSPWRSPVRLSGDLGSRMVMHSKKGSTVIAVRGRPQRGKNPTSYTDF